MSEDALIQQLQRLSPDRIQQVQDFVDFLLEKDAEVEQHSIPLSQTAFEKVWDNAEDEVYDAL